MRYRTDKPCEHALASAPTDAGGYQYARLSALHSRLSALGSRLSALHSPLSALGLTLGYLALGASWSCTPSAPVEYIEVRSPEAVRSFFVAQGGSTGAGSTILDATTRNFSEILTHVSRQRQVFVLPGDVEAGVSPDQYIQLPPVAGPAEDRLHQIAGLDPSKPWESIRVYDTGKCSSLPFENTWRALTLAIPGGLAAELQTRNDLVNPQVVAYRIAPVIRAEATTTGAPILLGDADFLHIDLLVRADRANGPIGITCFSPEIRITFDLQATLVSPQYGTGAIVQRVLEDGTPYQTPTATCCFERIPEFRNIEVNVVGGNVTVAQQEGATGRCRPRVMEHIRVGFQAVASTVASELSKTWTAGLERDREAVGLAPRACQEEVDCNETDGPWRGHLFDGNGYFISDQEPLITRTGRCNLDTQLCTVRLAPNRLNFRPEGMEMVWADGDTDMDSAALDADVSDCDVRRNAPAVEDAATRTRTGWQSAPFVRRSTLLGPFDPASVLF